MRPTVFAVRLTAVFLVVSCVSEPERVPCPAGIEAPCVCDDGGRGVAVCSEDGGRFGACDCSAIVFGVQTDGSMDGSFSTDGAGETGTGGTGGTMSTLESGVRSDAGHPDPGPGCGAYGAYDSGECIPSPSYPGGDL